jgi:hypothetical protein
MKSYKELLEQVDNFNNRNSIRSKYNYAKNLMSIGEHVGKICKLILQKPEKFEMIESGTVEYKLNALAECYQLNGVVVMRDIHTGVDFVFKAGKCCKPDYLNEVESAFLFKCAQEWYSEMEKGIKNKKQLREQKRKDKHRQEMIEMYKDL